MVHLGFAQLEEPPRALCLHITSLIHSSMASRNLELKCPTLPAEAPGPSRWSIGQGLGGSPCCLFHACDPYLVHTHTQEENIHALFAPPQGTGQSHTDNSCPSHVEAARQPQLLPSTCFRLRQTAVTPAAGTCTRLSKFPCQSPSIQNIGAMGKQPPTPFPLFVGKI